MYGFIYSTLRNLVILHFNEETWLQICCDAGIVELKDGILDRHYYNESYLGSLGVAASKRLDLPLETILDMFGGFFFVTCKKSGHSSMLRTLGHDLYGFLMNLDTLHDHLSVTYTQMAAPSFRCEKTLTTITLHYYSQRAGLSSIVQGIVKAVAEDFFALDIHIEEMQHEVTTQALAHHYIFSIECTDSPKNSGNYLERLTGDINVAPTSELLSSVEEREYDESLADCPFTGAHNTGTGHATGRLRNISITGNHSNTTWQENSTGSADIAEREGSSRTELSNSISESIKQQLNTCVTKSSLNMPNSLLPLFSMPHMQSSRNSIYAGDISRWPISHSLFQSCFPFHIIFDKDLVICYMGISFMRLFPRAVATAALLSDYFVLNRPAISLTHTNICSAIHNVFIMSANKASSNNAASKEMVQFRGQMIPTSSKEGSDILFVGSPRVNTIEDLEQQGLYLSDIPVHDVTRDLILLNQHFHVERNTAAELQQMKRNLEVEKSKVEHEKNRADMLLHSMLPPSIASELKNGAHSTAMDYESVTILFSDIKGFTTICNSCSPFQVVGMLNSLYSLFDDKSEFHNVYKVETIGDAYMVAAGLLDTADEHTEAIINMAFSMREEAGKVLEPVNKIPLQIRIGIHTGPVVAGVVGRRMPRFCLFGDTVNTASRMESHGQPGMIHLSEEAYCGIKEKPLRFFSRGSVDIKGLGLRPTYFVERLQEGEEPGIVPLPVSHKKSVDVTVVELRSRIPQDVSSFLAEEKDGKSSLHQSKVMDSICKPHPSEQAWVRNRKRSTTSPAPEPVLDDMESLQQVVVANSLVSPGVADVEVNTGGAYSVVSSNQLQQIRALFRTRWKCTLC